MKYIQNFNYHTHTERCGHAEKDYEDEAYVKEAFERGIKFFAFTDHMPFMKTKDTKTNMVSVTNAKVGKKSILQYQVLATKNGHTLVEIHLETGRPHQIRVQFASRNLPLVGDQRYNKNAKKVQIALWAVSLTFPHPTTKDKITLHSDPPEIWPWTEFEVKLWQK